MFKHWYGSVISQNQINIFDLKIVEIKSNIIFINMIVIVPYFERANIMNSTKMQESYQVLIVRDINHKYN